MNILKQILSLFGEKLVPPTSPNQPFITFMHFRAKEYNFITFGTNYPVSKIAARGGMTVAVLVEGLSLKFAYAKCAMTDNYNREIGRNIALARLHRGINVVEHSFLPEQNLLDAVLEAMRIEFNTYDGRKSFAQEFRDVVLGDFVITGKGR